MHHSSLYCLFVLVPCLARSLSLSGRTFALFASLRGSGMAGVEHPVSILITCYAGPVSVVLGSPAMAPHWIVTLPTRYSSPRRKPGIEHVVSKNVSEALAISSGP
jgi:hypothetical protein